MPVGLKTARHGLRLDYFEQEGGQSARQWALMDQKTTNWHTGLGF